MSAPKRYWMDESWDASGVTPTQLQEFGFSTVDELQVVRDARLSARMQLSKFMARPDVAGPEKQRARCAYIHEHGRLPYQCKGCWLLPGFCVCSKLKKSQPKTRVVIHLHQDEWGRGSNTGCLCGSSLSGCELLLRGHAPHDEQLDALLSDPDVTTALLWPGDDALEPQQLQELAAQRSNGRIALVAIDATWGGALRMKRRYPEGVLTMRLPPELALPDLHDGAEMLHRLQSNPQQSNPQDSLQQAAAPTDTAGSQSPSSPSSRPHQSSGTPGGAGDTDSGTSSMRSKPPPSNRHVPSPGERVSLFRGVRKYHGKAAANGRVSTLEAVAAALLALEGDEDMYRALLFNLKLKVDAMRQQKHMPPVYGLSGEHSDEEE